MSKESAVAFCEKLETDEALRSEVTALGASESGEVLVPAERVVEFGVQKGFSFSAREFCDAWMDRSRVADGELKDSALDAVSGGAGVAVRLNFTMFLPNGTPVRAGGPLYDYADDFSP